MKEEYMGFRLGDRLRMIDCTDPYSPILPGEKGTIDFIDDLGTLHMNWDNGRTLGVCLGEDRVSRIPLTQEFINFDTSSVMECGNDVSFEEHTNRAYEAISKMEEVALDTDGAWVVRSSFLDHGNKARMPEYTFVNADGLNEMLQGADLKNGIDVGYLKAGKSTSFVMIAHGQAYASPQREDIVKEAFECKLVSREAAADFQERLDAGWSEKGDNPRKLFFSPRDHQSLSHPIMNCGKLFVSHEKSHNIKRNDYRDI